MTPEEFLRSRGWLPAAEVYLNREGGFAEWLDKNGKDFWVSPHPMYFTLEQAVNEELRLNSGQLLPSRIDKEVNPA